MWPDQSAACMLHDASEPGLQQEQRISPQPTTTIDKSYLSGNSSTCLVTQLVQPHVRSHKLLPVVWPRFTTDRAHCLVQTAHHHSCVQAYHARANQPTPHRACPAAHTITSHVNAGRMRVCSRHRTVHCTSHRHDCTTAADRCQIVQGSAALADTSAAQSHRIAPSNACTSGTDPGFSDPLDVCSKSTPRSKQWRQAAFHIISWCLLPHPHAYLPTRRPH